ncbi:hypothetical protein O1R50_09140 [Glycomyces luteolus]|uniref:VWA domain containing CoxE-like protein n=1 Tax=Glycomyces luteolus TaxID=2670330 RepID=A0A9X3SQ67_9ACTN|nr:hypothetical protein [Glycomyces luteolus]MDA1359786.1 hypothetical protein [Glycomyces luteolus]
MKPSPHNRTKTVPTPCHPDWQDVSQGLTALLATMTGGARITVTASPGAAHGAPGCFLRDLGIVELDADRCFPGMDPADIDVTDTFDHFWYPTAIGVLAHEAAHVRNTRWIVDESWPALVGRAAMLLEEVRIEAAHLKYRPGDRQWLRSASADLDLGTGSGGVSAALYPLLGLWYAADAACRCLGRVDAGVLDATDAGIGAARTAITAVCGADLLGKLETIWRDAIATANHDGDRMRDLAVAWCRLLISQQAKEVAAAAAAAGTLDQATEAAAEALADAAADTPTAADPDASAGWDISGSGGVPGGSSTAEAGRKLWDKFTSPRASRDATDDERAAARQLAATIRKAAQRPRTHTKTPSQVPPGRLRMRGALNAKAQQTSGALVTAQPWQQRTKQTPPDPQARVGIAVDVSGSMGDWFDPAGACAWIFAHATDASGGSAAATTFGERARAMLAVGEVPQQVPLPVLEYATDHADVAIAALIESLDLDSEDGNARFLVLITDGDLAQDQVKLVAAQCKTLTESGCAILQLGPDRSTHLADAEFVGIDQPAEAIDVIADAVTDALHAAAQTP